MCIKLGGGSGSHVKLFVYFKLNNEFGYKLRGVYFLFALFCTHNGTASHITEEDPNPLLIY